MSTVTPSAPTLIIVSGLSGSGKSVALKTFEDQDYYCSDNLPINLLPDFVRSLLANHDGSAPRRLA
ncbi:RNase adapter RapZ, partial [Enterobacter hormaechei]